MPRTPYERLALDDVNLTIPQGKITAIAGHTGSGKSTLIQHLNGLLEPAEGQVLVDGVSVIGKKPENKKARRSVGMVFQYPEHQLFEETVAKDIAFGPRNYGCSEEDIQQRVKAAMDFVKLDYDTYKDRSPFQLSGGQMRRVAIAGVVALETPYLVLDEPTAGLDPVGREELMTGIVKLHKKRTIRLLWFPIAWMILQGLPTMLSLWHMDGYCWRGLRPRYSAERILFIRQGWRCPE